MPEVYDDAAQRHWLDASLLEKEKRLSNADQLCGIAAECAIKFAVSHLPGCLQEGKLSKSYRKHVELLWDLVPLQGLQKRFPGLIAIIRAGRPFSDWSIDQRYEPDSFIHADAAERHREAAKRLLGSVSLLGTRRRS
jgi:hypothetical protein